MARAEALGVGLEDLSLEALREVCPAIEAGVFAVLTPEAAVARRETPGGTGPASVQKQLADIRVWLADAERALEETA